MRVRDLKNKEVINSSDCKILGTVCDVDVDLFTGKIIAIIVPGPCRVFGFLGRESEYIIPYDCVCKIGPDIILVNVCEEKVLFKIC